MGNFWLCLIELASFPVCVRRHISFNYQDRLSYAFIRLNLSRDIFKDKKKTKPCRSMVNQSPASYLEIMPPCHVDVVTARSCFWHFAWVSSPPQEKTAAPELGCEASRPSAGWFLLWRHWSRSTFPAARCSSRLQVDSLRFLRYFASSHILRTRPE